MTPQAEDKAYTEKVASDLGWGPDFGLSAAMFLVQLGVRFKSAFASLETVLKAVRNFENLEISQARELVERFALHYSGAVTGDRLAKDALAEDGAKAKELRFVFNRMVKLLQEAGDASMGGMSQNWRDRKNEVLWEAERFSKPD